MTISSPSTLDSSNVQDNKGNGAIQPVDMRAIVDSLAGIATTSQTTSYTLVLADRGTMIEMNSGSSLNLTIPLNSSVTFDVGTTVGICQMGAGQVTVVATGGVTLRNPSSLTTRAQYSTISVRKRATDEWVVSGDLT